ncbi:hypothetical protein NLN92_14265, partial [Citrobacter portucalensis]|uniref:hypothetical protein n=1 Tax=Citrobacter portucalensis TaxID=1639133 RepID=UPI00226BA737
MMMNSKAPSQKATSTKRKVFHLAELEALAKSKGVELIYHSQNRYFTLKKPDSEQWVWIVQPESEQIVKAIRELTRPQWHEALDFNIKRLNAD